jgi:hypothetical protein
VRERCGMHLCRLMSLRPHMNVSLAVGLSCVPTCASSSAMLTLTKRAAAKAMAFTAARFTAEHAMMERIKLRMNGGVAMRNGSKKSVACTFAAGMLAHTLMTVALGGAVRLTAKTVRALSPSPLPCREPFSRAVSQDGSQRRGSSSGGFPACSCDVRDSPKHPLVCTQHHLHCAP